MPSSLQPHILIVEARYYPDLSDALLEGAKAALDEAKATYDVVIVPSALELPVAVAMALDGAENGATEYDGYVVLGVVILDETKRSHIIANESSRAIMDLAVSESLAIGNGILAVDNDAQAWLRARRTDGDAGGFAASVALSMVGLKTRLGGQ